MTKNINVTIDGEAYPCRPTMGAMLRFRQETGREVTEMDPSSFSDLCTYLWCCIVSACRKEKRAFDMSLMDFADSIEPSDMVGWSESIMSTDVAHEGDAAEKKSRSGRKNS